ncbi:MAG: hypothetical protein ACLPZR_05815 [Solirubrobacteraceae bacterium]
MSRHNTLTPDPRDMRPTGRSHAAGRAPQTSSALAVHARKVQATRHPNRPDVLAQARTVQVTVDPYLALADEIRTVLAAEAPVGAADFLPAGADRADIDPVF